MSHLHYEIHEQAHVVQNLLDAENDNAKSIAQAIRDFNPSFVMIAARGTSDNAARYAQYLMGIQAGLPVALATPSVHTLYEAQPRMGKALVIGISQSGRSADVIQVMTDARQQGALTIGISNYADSPMAEAAHYHIALHAGEEKSVAATKTYTTELVALALLTQHLIQDEANLARLRQIPQDMQATLINAEGISAWAQRYRYMERIALIGRGYNYCTAFEIALKIKELCYVVGEEYSEADFRHGPIAIISQGFPVMAIAPTGKTYDLMVDLLHKLREKQAECLVISDSPKALDLGVNGVLLPPNIPEWLSPICAVMPGQVFGYHLALAKGYDIDAPRGLNKVTITR